MELRPYREVKRKKTRVISVGKVLVGGESPIRVQSMTNTLTTNDNDGGNNDNDNGNDDDNNIGNDNNSNINDDIELTTNINDNTTIENEVLQKVKSLCDRFPLYPSLSYMKK